MGSDFPLQNPAPQAPSKDDDAAMQHACKVRRQVRHAIKVGVHEANAGNPMFLTPQGPAGAGEGYF